MATNGSTTIDFTMIGECLAVARRNCSTLAKHGLDLLFLVDDLFAPFLSEAISEHISTLEGILKTSSDEDDFMDSNQPGTISLSLLTFIDIVGGVTKSAAVFSKLVTQLLNDLQPVMIDAYSELIVSRIAGFVEHYATSLLQASYPPDLSIIAFLGIVNDCDYVSHKVLPQVTTQLSDLFRRSFSDLNRLYARLDGKRFVED